MGTPFGIPRKTISPNGQEYKAMAESVLAKLQEHMSEIEFKAWKYREFDARGLPFEKCDHRLVWMKALSELSFPAECECSGLPDNEHVFRLCASIAHVSSLAEVGV